MKPLYKVWIQLERINDPGTNFETYEDDGLPDPILSTRDRDEAIALIRGLLTLAPENVRKNSDYREFPRRPDIQEVRRRLRDHENECAVCRTERGDVQCEYCGQWVGENCEAKQCPENPHSTEGC